MSDKQQGGTFTTAISPPPPPPDPILRKQFVSHPLLPDVDLPAAALPDCSIISYLQHLSVFLGFRPPFVPHSSSQPYPF